MKILNLPNSNDLLYKSILNGNFEEARALINGGAQIPELLATQATWHDNSRIVSFLFEIQPKKQNELIQLVARQGAVNSLKCLVENHHITLPSSLLTVSPRKNENEILQFIQSNIKLIENGHLLNGKALSQ